MHRQMERHERMHRQQGGLISLSFFQNKENMLKMVSASWQHTGPTIGGEYRKKRGRGEYNEGGGVVLWNFFTWPEYREPEKK
jgi:hypothetical protein